MIVEGYYYCLHTVDGGQYSWSCTPATTEPPTGMMMSTRSLELVDDKSSIEPSLEMNVKKQQLDFGLNSFQLFS